MHLLQKLELKFINLGSCIASVASLVLMADLYSKHWGNFDLMVKEFDCAYSRHALALFSNSLAVFLLLVHQFYSSSLFKKSLISLYLHIAVHLISPVLPSSTLVCVSYDYQEICYSVNDLVIILMFVRIFLLYMALIQFTMFFDIYCFTTIKSIGPTYFASKCLMTQHKILMCAGIILAGNHYCAYILSVLESRGGNPNLVNMVNANWCAFISGFSIGLGDLYPHTILGRSITVLWIFFASAFSWYFALAVSDCFTMNRIQFLVYKDINRMTKAIRFIEAWMLNPYYLKEKQEFRNEMRRQYTSPNNYGTFIIDLYEIPPEDLRPAFVRLNILEKNYESLYCSIEDVSIKFSNMFMNEDSTRSGVHFNFMDDSKCEY